jgi:hypothetical protein
MKPAKLFFVLMLAFSASVFAQQQGDYSKEPGYFDFGDITSLKAGEFTTEVYLEEPLLKMVAKMGETKDEEVGNLIGALKLVKVNEFMVDKNNSQKLDNDLNALQKNLELKKWNRIIKTKHANSDVSVFVKNAGGDGFAGLVITAVDSSGKVSLVNIVGNINLETIGKLSKQFHFPNVDKMKEKQKEKGE